MDKLSKVTLITAMGLFAVVLVLSMFKGGCKGTCKIRTAQVKNLITQAKTWQGMAQQESDQPKLAVIHSSHALATITAMTQLMSMKEAGKISLVDVERLYDDVKNTYHENISTLNNLCATGGDVEGVVI